MSLVPAEIHESMYPVAGPGVYSIPPMPLQNNIRTTSIRSLYLFDFAAGILAAYLLQENHALAAWVSRWGKKVCLVPAFSALAFCDHVFIQG